MTEPDAMPTLDASDAPRRLMMADLVARLAAGVQTLAGEYETAAGQAQGALGQTLAGLARAKETQAADLAPLATALGVSAPFSPRVAPRKAPPSWGVILGTAFQGERAMERTGRELAALATAPPAKALGTRLAAEAARDGKVVRKLYLLYS